MTAVLFIGPTLPADAARALPDAVVLPPARQGDIWRAVRAHRPVAIGLIDGVFLHEPAVWHREILWAMREGVHVFGAASMGALRAAELAAFGMRGVGRVFAAYRDGVWPGFAESFEDDDEVAVLHAPSALGARPLSDAMVDVRDTLLAAVCDGVLGERQCYGLAARLKALPFGERSFARLADCAGEWLNGEARGCFAAWLRHGVVARKRLDALDLLREMEQFLRDRPPPFVAAFRFECVQVWQDFVDAAEGAAAPEEALVLEEARLQAAEWGALVWAAAGRMRAVAAAPASTEAAMRQSFDQFRRARGLGLRADLDQWLSDNAVTADALDRMMQHAAAAARAPVPPGLDVAIADELRRTGRFDPLLRRARAKQAALAGSPPAVAGPVLDAALAWYAERQDGDVARHGWDSEDGYRSAVWREYLFMQWHLP